MQINIEKIIYPGKSLGRTDNKVVLTDSGIDGETVQCTSIKDKKNYTQAKTTSIINPSAHRTTPRCSHFTICSAYQYIDYEYQLKIKAAQLKEILSDYNTQIKSFDLHSGNVIWGYRNKIHLHVITKNNSAVCAYHTPETSDEFTPIDRCYLASEVMNKLITKFLQILNSGLSQHVNEFTLQRSSSSKKFLLCCFGELEKNQHNILAPLLELSEKFMLAGIVYMDKKRNKKIILFGKDQLTEKVAGRNFLFGSQSFFQINIPMLELLIQDIKNEVPITSLENMLDLYCGVGTFAIALSELFSNITAVEYSKANISFLKKNLSINSISNIQAIHAKCEDWINIAQEKNPDIIIVDPPRRGLEQSIIKQINKIKPAFIAYVSCDPATLCRDLKNLSQEYTLKKLFAYDFFPHTPHIETLSILERN